MESSEDEGLLRQEDGEDHLYVPELEEFKELSKIEPPQKINDLYTITGDPNDFLGSGAFGIVYKAKKIGFEQPFAIKLV